MGKEREQTPWQHPGGKLLAKGAETLTDAELLAILLSSGVKGRPAIKIAEDIMRRFSSFRGMANQPLDKLLKIRGIGEKKAVRIAAAFEMARRIVNEVIRQNEQA
jgi:DNA repair protein RadC